MLPIQGKVARILSDRELVLNVGSQQGVHIGMYFAILDPKGTDIKDPDTGMSLGSVNRPKLHVKITSIQEKLSVASTFKKTKVNEGGQGIDFAGFGAISGALLPPKWVSRVQTFRAEEAAWKDIDEKDSIVKVGDPAVQEITLVTEEDS